MVNIKVVDSIMGSGKTSGAIEMMNNVKFEDNHFIYITPFLKEVDRIKKSTTRRFYDPKIYSNGNEKFYKMDSFHDLLSKNKDIVATHSLFKKSNDETRDLIHAGNYTLILDEVMDVVDKVMLKKDDLDLLFSRKLISIKDNGQVVWNEDEKDYDTIYNDIKAMALSGNLIYFRNTVLVWNFPVDIFNAFTDVYILTYMFDAQLQKYYYDLHNIKYDKLVAKYDGGKYIFTESDDDKEREIKQKIKDKIHIYYGNLNAIGDDDYSLSKSWYMKKSDYYIKKIKNNIFNYFHNLTKSKSQEAMWTTFKKFQFKLKGKGYTNGFIACNARATNEFKERTNLAYMINRFCDPMISGFFDEHKVTIDEEAFALSEMIQWIWRSAIRDEKEINIYIPSSRMRQLFIDWLN